MIKEHKVFMSRGFKIFIALTLGLILSGCKTITLDESLVFQPGLFGNEDEVPPTTKLRYESVLLEPSNLIIDVWADRQKAKHIIRPSDYVKSTITHDFIASEDERLGITWVERSKGVVSGTPRPLVVHCGGNASDRYESGTLYVQKIIANADVFLFDYPGYGESTGAPTTQSFQAANRIVSNHVRSRLKPDQKLILWGHSLGGFVCSDMAALFTSVDGIVLEASATNAEDVSKAVIPWFAKPFIKTRVTENLQTFDTAKALQNINAPILILGATKDKTLPVELSQILAERLNAAGRDVTYVEFPEGNHISIPTQDTYLPAIEAFMMKINGRAVGANHFGIAAR